MNENQNANETSTEGKHLALNQSYKSKKNGFVLWLSPLTGAMCEEKCFGKGGSIRTKAAYIAGRRP